MNQALISLNLVFPGHPVAVLFAVAPSGYAGVPPRIPDLAFGATANDRTLKIPPASPSNPSK